MGSLFLAFLCLMTVRAQDERYWRQVLLPNLAQGDSPGRHHFKVSSPVYHVDLNRDGRAEGIRMVKKDHQDWLFIEDHRGVNIFKQRFFPQGPKSYLSKIQIRQLSQRTKVLILHYYEGATHYLDFRSTGRLYFLTIDNDDLKTISVFRGPIFWHEEKNRRKQYYHRRQEISLFDFDGDGVKEIAIRYHTITEIFKYKKAGAWATF